MTKILLALLSAGLVYTLYLNNQLTRRDAEIGKMLADQTEKVAKLELDLKRIRGRTQAQVDEDRALSLELQRKIGAKKSELSDLDTQLARLRSGEGRDVEANSAREAFENSRNQLSELSQKLEAIRARRKQIRNSETQGTDQARQARSYDDAGLGGEIRAEEAQLQSLQLQLKDLKSRIGDIDARAQIGPTNQQIAAVKAKIDQLKLQKKNLDEEWGAQQSLVHAQSGTTLAQLKAQEEDLVRQYSAEKVRSANLERDWKDLQGNRQQEKSRIQALLTDRDRKKTELSDLQNQLAEIQKKLSDLGAAAQ